MPSITVGTTAIPVSADTTELSYGVQLRADLANTGKVYVGPVGVTARSAPATDGQEMGPGDSYFVTKQEADRPSKVYLIATAAGQVVGFKVI